VGWRKFVGLFAAFGIWVAFIYGFTTIGISTIPILAGVLIIFLVFGIWKGRNR
jgi:hypothetical protein